MCGYLGIQVLQTLITYIFVQLYCCECLLWKLYTNKFDHSDARSAVSVCRECHVCSLGLLAGYWVRAIVQDFQRLHANQQLTHNFRKVKKRNTTRPEPHCLIICLFVCLFLFICLFKKILNKICIYLFIHFVCLLHISWKKVFNKNEM